MMKKKILYILTFLVLLSSVNTACNSAHELMEPIPLSLSKKKLDDDYELINYYQKNGVVVINNDGKKVAEEKNFITALNKFLNIKYANILGVLPQVITNDLLYNFIDEWYGTRYRMGGTDKRGIDCSAFVQRLYLRVFNVSLFRTAAEQFSLCTSIYNKQELKEGDLVFFSIHTKRISHVGIYLMNDFFVHSATSKGVMISKLTDDYWRKYFVGAGRVSKDRLKQSGGHRPTE
ncbi:MAG: NlpC/P60 family protein [Phycisphaerales bacterium]|nr:NlpC/P60 family protein [Phycisphaerales bacterium]